MNQGALDRNTFETIEAYVLERMTADERAAFEQRLASDASLREEVALERDNILAVELGGISRMLKGIAREERTESRSATNWMGYLKYAAVIAGIVSGTIWWMNHTPTNEQLYAEHYTPDPGLPVAMGTTNNAVFADAMVAYKLGDYDEARAKWSPLLAQQPGNDTLCYYIASAWLAEGNTREAVTMLDALTKENSSPFRTRARWFLFLAYVHEGEIGKAQAIGLDNDPTYGERVRAIQAGLSR